jgi:hypothetical protein
MQNKHNQFTGRKHLYVYMTFNPEGMLNTYSGVLIMTPSASWIRLRSSVISDGACSRDCAGLK